MKPELRLNILGCIHKLRKAEKGVGLIDSSRIFQQNLWLIITNGEGSKISDHKNLVT